ncbi:hypothetical protein CEXT_284211 [Caerostris extrusa]|uniref:Uncharacterized protein n=1 Tax=Caerostris extrusa TaxID=172846 RepID=A0AAV4XPD6_CAEEX|nr:hypothetical protein CEXT_284211 [Caerostris extrusa]
MQKQINQIRIFELIVRPIGSDERDEISQTRIFELIVRPIGSDDEMRFVRRASPECSESRSDDTLQENFPSQKTLWVIPPQRFPILLGRE